MSYNEPNVEKSARRHRPAIWAIGFAVLAAIIAGLVFAPWRGDGTQSEVVPPAVTGTAGNAADGDAATVPAGTAAPAVAPATEGAAPAATGG